MTISIDNVSTAKASSLTISHEMLTVELDDGRTLSVPQAWYPRLQRWTARERSKWRLLGGGEGIHWPELDEDISVAGLLAGKRSAESKASVSKWAQGRKKRSGRNTK